MTPLNPRGRAVFDPVPETRPSRRDAPLQYRPAGRGAVRMALSQLSLRLHLGRLACACRGRRNRLPGHPIIVIRFENVSKTYDGQRRAALANVNVDIEKGEFVFL